VENKDHTYEGGSGFGYHGYWALNIYEVNLNFGSKQDLLDLVEECHRRDMYVMVDIVVNHMGNQETCNAVECPDITDFSEFVPFDQPEHYHDYCPISDIYDQDIVEDCRLSFLPGKQVCSRQARKLHSRLGARK